MIDHLNEIRNYNVRHAWPRLEKCALLVIDMQNYFFPMSNPIIDNVVSIVEACRRKRIKTFFTRHGHQQVEEDGGMLLKWWGDCIRYGTREWEIISTFSPAETDHVVDKNRYSAFLGTGLDDLLQSRGLEELIITGVMTNCCCETTARDAFMRDYRVFFVSDATATVNEELHIATLKNLAFGFAHILNTSCLCRYLET